MKYDFVIYYNLLQFLHSFSQMNKNTISVHKLHSLAYHKLHWNHAICSWSSKGSVLSAHSLWTVCDYRGENMNSQNKRSNLRCFGIVRHCIICRTTLCPHANVWPLFSCYEDLTNSCHTFYMGAQCCTTNVVCDDIPYQITFRYHT